MESVAFVLLVQGTQDERSVLRKNKTKKGSVAVFGFSSSFLQESQRNTSVLNGETNRRFDEDPAREI
jgi:hypothetical protein